MNQPFHVDMQEVTRLTQDGRLKEAVALLHGQRPSGDPDPSTAASQKRTTPFAGSASVIEMVPPSAGTRGAWTPPQFTNSHGSDSHAQGPTIPQAPESLRDLLKHVEQWGASSRRGKLRQFSVQGSLLCQKGRASKSESLRTRQAAEPTSSTFQAVSTDNLSL